MPPSEDDSVRRDVFGQLSHYRGQVFIQLVENPKCQMDTFSDGIKQLRRLTQFSMGLLGFVKPDNIVDVR